MRNEKSEIRNPKSEIRRILIIRFSSLGDVALASVVIDALKEAFPSSELILLVGASYAGLYEGDPRLAGVFRFERTGRGTVEEVRAVRGTISPLRKRDFDAIVDLQGSFRSRMIGLAIPARRRVRYPKRHCARAAMVHAKWIPVRTVPTVQVYLRALRGLGLSRSFRLPRLLVPSDASERADELLRHHGIGSDDRIVGINPGVRWSGKRWTSEGFAAIADALLERMDVRVLFLGDEGDTDFVRTTVERMTRNPLILTGTLGLSELKAVIRRCAVLLTNDSGPMHIATAVGTPVVALFGPTHPKLGFAPCGPQDRVITLDLPCSPCTLHGNVHCRYPTRRCMEGIEPERVFGEVLQQLRSNV